MIERKEIWEFSSRIEKEKEHVLNPNWIRVYDNLLGALDYLDACIARSTVSYKTAPADITEEEKNKIIS